MSLIDNYWAGLKIDKDRPYHFIIGVCMKQLPSKDAGQVYLKYGPVRFTNQDVANVRDATVMINDKWIKVKQGQALDNFECRGLVCNLSAMRYSVRANQGTMHHFSSEFEIDDEFFDTFVKQSNKFEDIKQKLEDSKIKGV